jgi:hypothetical protein
MTLRAIRYRAVSRSWAFRPKDDTVRQHHLLVTRAKFGIVHHAHCLAMLTGARQLERRPLEDRIGCAVAVGRYLIQIVRRRGSGR